MPDREMTPERALIILDRLNTDERIEVDRAELKEAVAVAKSNEHIKQDCKYCVDNTDAKVKLPFWCGRQKHYVSKKNCDKCDLRVHLNQLSIDGKSNW